MSEPTAPPPVAASGRIRLGELSVYRLGYGAMRLAGPGAWGPPPDPDEAVRAVRRAVELGVDFIDTADSYGPFTSEQLLKRALHPYPDGLVIATKAGQTRPSREQWVPLGRPEYIRQQCELSLRHLGVERIDLFQIHRLDPLVEIDTQLETLRDLQAEGKVDQVGLSNVTLEQAAYAVEALPLASIQNPYSLARREHERLVELCERAGVAFIPWAPIAAGGLAGSQALAAVAAELGLSPVAAALGWLLARSPVMLPIPGSASVAHVEENCAAAAVSLDAEAFARIGAALGQDG